MTVALTFDTDWAPDFVLEYVCSILADYDLEATMFFTNKVGFDIPDFIETGIHPDFRTCGGVTPEAEKLINELLFDFPNTKGFRSHRMFWDYGLYDLLPKQGVIYDSSIFLPFHANLEINRAYGDLLRIPVWWTDNLHLERQLSLNSAEFLDLSEPGLKVLIFHPIHVYLNSSHRDVYREKVQLLGDLRSLDISTLEPLRHQGVGIETLLKVICRKLKTTNVCSSKLEALASVEAGRDVA
ncbi:MULTISPECIES: hypothetical protein [unclassified Okeania]|uniref:polysaccharide deacetylase WbmS family protein n=1 Tax=unclassified Okeania TaxID=2634635 RepID=UPI0013B8230C|nr:MULTISPECIES: hypothetical protein [unclassified Okeania]NES79692.1 hypothetical protein [Okeania sp. SIO1H4]NES90192.1 hypothetical protein [Okeania sp. SIO2B9]NET23385.1 hypothetical protein [Okeania sp. SIO1H5]NET97080.1 hypothetical protein [Okeania sp. SIO1H2]